MWLISVIQHVWKCNFLKLFNKWKKDCSFHWSEDKCSRTIMDSTEILKPELSCALFSVLFYEVWKMDVLFFPSMHFLSVYLCYKTKSDASFVTSGSLCHTPPAYPTPFHTFLPVSAWLFFRRLYRPLSDGSQRRRKKQMGKEGGQCVRLWWVCLCVSAV